MNSEENIYWSEFLELYESMPCLWKIKSSEYCNRELKNKCYAKMIEKLKEIDKDASREKVIKKINTFRTNYKRDLKKVKNSEKSGAGVDDIFVSSLWYFDKLKFLDDQECSREGKCTMDTEGCNAESGDDELVNPPPKRKECTEDNLLKMACKKLANSDDTTSFVPKGWAAQYEELTKRQKAFTRTIIADVLFYGYLDRLTEQSVEDIHNVLKGDLCQTEIPYLPDTSTPYASENTFSPQSCSSPNQYFVQPSFSSQHPRLFFKSTNKQNCQSLTNQQKEPTETVDHFFDQPLFSPEQTQTFIGSINKTNRQQIKATDTLQQMPTSIAQFITNFVDDESTFIE